MSRTIRPDDLKSKTARASLPKQGKPYWLALAPGIALGYRRSATAGTWNVRCSDGKGGNWVKKIALADDHEDANGKTVLNYSDACDAAKRIARGGGQDADTGRPVTVSEALDAYAGDLATRGRRPTNETRVRKHLSPVLLAKLVSMLTTRELRMWRDGLVKAGMPASTVNRVCNSFKAALNYAAEMDRTRITNAHEWKVALKRLAEAEDTESNLVLSDKQRRAVIFAAYEIGEEFGLYVEVHAATGARSSQIALLNVSDLILGAAPKLTVPSSLKGRNRTTRTRKPLPIPAGLGVKLKKAAAGRADNAPLLVSPWSSRWDDNRRHRRWFNDAALAAKLPNGATPYCLRHTAITNALLKGAPIRLIAASFDTSVAMIERTYSKNINDHGDEQMRRAMFDIEPPITSNVVPLKAKA